MNASIRWWSRCALTAAMAGVLSVGVAAQKPDPVSGVWKLDVAKSKFSPGPAAKSGLVTIDATGTTRTVSAEGVTGDGTAMKWGYTATTDGKEAPVTGNPDGDTISVKRISPSSVESTLKKAGKVTVVNTATVSADGKTLTVTTTGTNAVEQKVNNVQVFEKQKG